MNTVEIIGHACMSRVRVLTLLRNEIARVVGYYDNIFASTANGPCHVHDRRDLFAVQDAIEDCYWNSDGGDQYVI